MRPAADWPYVMRRRIVHFVTALAFVAVAVLLVAAVASFWFSPRLTIVDANRTSYGATVDRGALILGLQYSAYYLHNGRSIAFVAPPIPRNIAPLPSGTFWNRRGFWAARTAYSLQSFQPADGWHAPAWFGLLGLALDQPVSSLTIMLPIWLPILFAAILPVVLVWKLVRRRNRLIAGCCTACGYDLRATPDRCPECGAVPGNVMPGT